MYCPNGYSDDALWTVYTGEDACRATLISELKIPDHPDSSPDGTYVSAWLQFRFVHSHYLTYAGEMFDDTDPTFSIFAWASPNTNIEWEKRAVSRLSLVIQGKTYRLLLDNEWLEESGTDLPVFYSIGEQAAKIWDDFQTGNLVEIIVSEIDGVSQTISVDSRKLVRIRRMLDVCRHGE